MKASANTATSQTASPAAKNAPPQPRADLPVPIKGPIPPLKLHALKKGAVRDVLKKLIEAHYDAERLGLRELRFKLAYASMHRNTSTKGEGHWRSGGPPSVKLGNIMQDGKTLARKSKVHQQMYQAMTYRMRRLLDGLGNGFLSRRLHDLKDLDAKVEKKNGTLELHFDLKDEAGSKMMVVVGKGYRVERIERSSTKGVIRGMKYDYQLEGGRNLVRSAQMMVRFTDDTKIPKKARAKLAAGNNSLFQIRYKKIGRFFVPIRLHKKMPATLGEITLDLTYSAALP
ncbi:MAG: hypothetical protein JRH20_10045 [Deltaproteobacteria bacterium]|nr:hypothetical protein [Deltaproteobacteria bacterium]